MTPDSATTRALAAAILGLGVMTAAAPAQAGGLGTGFLAGLIGGAALGALGAPAYGYQGDGYGFSGVPADLGAPVYVDAPRSVRRPSRRGREQPGRSSTPRLDRAARYSSEIARCRELLRSRARELGAVNVTVSSAGSEVRGRHGGVELPLNARIEYARNGKKQVRQAHVRCSMNTDGQVVALR